MLAGAVVRSEEYTSELQSHEHLVCRLLLVKKRSLGRPRGRRRPGGGSATLRTGGRHADATVTLHGQSALGRDPSCVSPGCVFFFNDTAPTEISTLSLHDALPI